MALRYQNDTGAQLFYHIHRFADPCQRIERVASETNLTWYLQRNPAKPSDSLTWLTNLANCLVSRFADVALVLAKALTSLHNLIKRDAHTLNETSVQRLRRYA